MAEINQVVAGQPTYGHCRVHALIRRRRRDQGGGRSHVKRVYRIMKIHGRPERAPFNEIVARYLKAVGDPREVVRDPAAGYFGGRIEERSLVPLGEARLGHIGVYEWLRRSQAKA